MSEGEATRAAGRGGLAIAGAKLTFIVFGLAQVLILTRLLGKAGYGQLRVVIAAVSIVSNTVVAASIQGVSRAVASAPEGREDEALRATLRVHAALALAVSLGFALLADTIAGFEKAPHLATPLRVVALVVLLYGLYAPLVGSLNGRRRFLAQAGLDTGYTVLRTLGLAVGAALFMRAAAGRGAAASEVVGAGVLGAVVGFVGAASVILPVALGRAGSGRAGDAGPSVREYLGFLLPVAGGQILLNLLMFTDGLLLRRFLGTADDADGFAGIYSAAQQFSFLPYQLLISITFILFPMLARAQADGDRAAVRAYTMSGVRLAMLLTALLTGTISGLAPQVLRVAFAREMWDGADALRILALAMGSFSVLGVTCAALTGLGRAVESAALTGLCVILIAAGCVAFVPRAEPGLPMLTTSATATLAALTTAAVVGGLRLRAAAGGFVAPATLVRALAALATCVAAGSRMPRVENAGKMVQAAVVGAEALAVAGLGLLVLIALREVGRDDLARVRAVMSRRRG